jgi:TolB-like protein
MPADRMAEEEGPLMARIARRHLIMRMSLAVLLALAAAGSARAQQAPDFGPLASKVSRAIEKNFKRQSGEKVLVLDFVEAQGTPTALGHELADAFSDSLGKEARDFGVVDRSQLQGLLARDRISPETFQDKRSMTCYGPELDAQIVLEGELDNSSNKVRLTVGGWRIEPRKKIFEVAIKLALTPEIQALLQKPTASFAISSADYVSQTGVPPSGKEGYSLPNCVQCHWPDFSEAAIAAHGQGTISLMSEIDATGVPRNIAVMRGLPCGLNQQAIDAVEKWKLEPATGPDGKPADVEQEIDVVFRLY